MKQSFADDKCEIDCKECNGSGYTTKIIKTSDCYECMGTKFKRTYLYALEQKDYTTYIYVGYLVLFLRNFENVKFHITGKRQVIAVKFDSGEGFIMPMRIDKNDLFGNGKYVVINKPRKNIIKKNLGYVGVDR